ncbi:MAG: N-formylglutamate amidohydrolase [Burkholderiaceae bacterium]|nr:N-formylglutamate amidohydrolase [Burkholderiales bacterium]MCZ8103415.1 N-formylglutamate amidohydrolase [Burkholderiales bacterium]MCZ8338943.1 N-formylglutamate amidohydrolase [Burkholderiaceae bacterium]
MAGRRTALKAGLLLPLPRAAGAYDPAGTVLAAAGTLPLILTVPHDGADALGWIAARTRGAVVRDVGTRSLAERVASVLERRTGRRPYLVVALFSRRYLDANRPEQDAMESPDALPAYRAYHDRVAAFVSELRAAFPAGALLLDVHGQGDEPGTTFRGTRGGLTTKALLDRHGIAALQGDGSLIGLIAAKGYTVHPAVGSDDLREDRRFAGGHTVATYGSHRPDGIDAIQLEFGRQHRADPRLPEDLGDALLAFMSQYGLLPR